MSENPYIRLKPLGKNACHILLWGLIWFILLNIVIWTVFDRKFFDWVGFDRLLMQPSDNEVQSMIDKIRVEDKKHLVLLGDSIVWGIGINDPGESVGGKLTEHFSDRGDIRVVNLSVPGNSYLDTTAMIRDSYDEENTYVFFVNPMLFRDYYALRDFGETVRFKELVKRVFRGHREDVENCCDLQIPPAGSEIQLWLHQVVFHLIPLYHNRDLIAKTLVGLHPSSAVNAVLHRMRTFSPSLFARKPMHVESTPDTQKEVIDFSGSRMLKVLRHVTELLGDRENVYYVILDDNMFVKNSVQDRNVKLIVDAIASDRILNLYRKIFAKNFLDAVHMKPSGHALVADHIVRFLSQHDAP